LPEPISELVRTLASTRRGHAALGDQGISPWLFPGGQPGRPISAYQLAQPLRKIGIRPAQARSTALYSLAAELPAAILARLLGIHIKSCRPVAARRRRRLDNLRRPLQPPSEHLNRQSRATADRPAPETDSDGLNIRLHQCRMNLDRYPNYILPAYMASGT
jgi:hypothetical protein